ncbi:hypothetical protein FLP10_03805 [Agromyces intestinalis]|uniref:Uncharacterized protein n=1 Tax=Agromyces intestinalis TaxID=2592652 RepID=A0A5C1YC30_9MICO|nr:hypothetical protein [Agromyces intestinalis]QEO13644.1 hypothetical protein FLP10_03805 [Agromyces intestinalis]
MPTRRAATTLAIAGLVLGSLLFTGCAGAAPADETADSAPTTRTEAPADEQNTDEAGDDGAAGASTQEDCLAFQGALTDSATALQEGMSEYSSDPAGAVATLKDFQGTFDAAVADLSDADVKAVGEDAGAKLDDVISTLDAAVADPASLDMEVYLGKVTAMTESFSAIGDVCAA